jgi:glucosamine--fructose-6-phosphate aminotransferase (isomerizing)
MNAASSHLERAIASQPAELARLAAYDLGSLPSRLGSHRRVWLVGTGSSQHVAELGALALADAGVDTRWCGSLEFARFASAPEADDAVIVISHSARTSFALAARERALASGADVVSITGVGSGWPEALETVAMERSETYTVSVTSALMMLMRLAHELGASGLAAKELDAAVNRVREIVEDPELPGLDSIERALVLVGTGAGAVGAREGALKLREAARVLAEGYEAEYLLHGHAVPLRRGDGLLLITPADERDGLLAALGEAASAEGLVIASIEEPSIAHPILVQLPIIVRLQLLALSLARMRSTDPDRAIVGRWADPSMWAIGRPGEPNLRSR